MAPKKDQDAATTADDKMKALCVLMATADEFSPNLEAAASEFGIAQPRNVTRKINAIIEPVGYTMIKRKITKVNHPAATIAGSSTPTTNKASVKATPKLKQNAKSAAKKPARKQLAVKVEQDEDEEGDNENSETTGEDEGSDEKEDEEVSPATKAIMEAIAGSDVTPDKDESA